VTTPEELYQQRLARYTTAMRNEQPDRVPLRPFVAEWTGRYAGYTCQEMAHDYPKALEAARRCARDFDWDAVVPDMIATWTGMLQAMGLRYYAIPGIDLPPDVGHQYREPAPHEAYMRADEYDQLIEDPTGFLLNIWLPRVAAPLQPIGSAVTESHNLSLIKGAMAMSQFFGDLQMQEQRLRTESGTVSAISGMLRAPLDMIADKLRGYLGLVDDLRQQPEKVLAACEALMPHLTHFALATADPRRNVPLGFWMHRGCVPFISPRHFDTVFWPTLKPIVQELWAHGHQTLFYAEGNWEHHLGAFAELPERSIVVHVDQTPIEKAHAALGDRFCLSGGVPNVLLSQGTADEVRQCCRNILQTVARDGGYIMDASAIIQNDATVENMRALTEATLEYGVYPRGHATISDTAISDAANLPQAAIGSGQAESFVTQSPGRRPPGICVPWTQAVRDIPRIRGDEGICRDVWQRIDAMANMYVWCVFLVF
jgi:uroporphyrinogen-III decarboxylase